MNIKTEVFWVVTPCSLVYVYRHSGGTSYPQISRRSANRCLKMFII